VVKLVSHIAIVEGVDEVESLLRSERHFIADVAGVSCRVCDPSGVEGFAVVDVPRVQRAIPLTTDWEHEFLCDGGFNRFVAAEMDFMLSKVERPQNGLVRLSYQVEIRV
jgi:hypothetical protein